MPSGNGQPRTYSIAGETASGAVYPDRLVLEIAAEGGITTGFNYLSTAGDDLEIFFVGVLGGGEQTALDAVVAAHTGAVLPGADANSERSADPTANDDSSEGYFVGFRWLNTTTDKEFVCLDDSVGAAVWRKTTAVDSGDLPGLADGNVWLGNGSNVATATSRSGIDDVAVHTNASGEISGVTEKGTPVSADLLLVEDSENSNAKRRVQVGNLPFFDWPFGNTHTVDASNTSADFTTIGAAITAASAGDTIFIAPGDYAEIIAFSKSLRLVGMGRTSSQGDGTSSRTRLRPSLTTNGGGAVVLGPGATEVVFENMEIAPVVDNTNESTFNAGVVWLAATGNLRLLDCTVVPEIGTGVSTSLGLYGIRVESAGDLILDNTRVLVLDANDDTSATKVAISVEAASDIILRNGTRLENGAVDGLGRLVLNNSSINALIEDAFIEDQLLVTSASSCVITGASRIGSISDSGGTITNTSEAGALRETGGPTSLAMGSVTAGQYLQRSGNTIVGANIVDSDEQVRISANDTTSGYLLAKLSAGATVTLTEQNDGGNETLQIASTDEQVRISANDTTSAYLLSKLVAGSAITLTEQNDGGNETLQIASSAIAIDAISVYDNTGGQTFTGTTTINLDTVAVNTNGTMFSLANDVVTVNQTGTFLITAQAGIGQTGNSRSESVAWVEQNDVEIDGTRAFGYHRNTSQMNATLSISRVVSVTSGDTFRLRSTRNSGTSTLDTEVDASRLTIVRLA